MRIITTHPIADLDESFEGHEYEIQIEWHASGRYAPARISAPPEECYEAEEPSFEIERITLVEFGRVYDLQDPEILSLIPKHELLHTVANDYQEALGTRV